MIEEDSTVTLKFLHGILYDLDSNYNTANEYIEHALLPCWLACLKNYDASFNREYKAKCVLYRKNSKNSY